MTNRGRVFAWGLWDWGSSAYNAVILTFVFSVYLTDAVGHAITVAASTGTINLDTFVSGIIRSTLAVTDAASTFNPSGPVRRQSRRLRTAARLRGFAASA